MPDVGSSETELRRPTCLFVQVIIGPNGKSGIAPDSIYCRGRFVFVLRCGRLCACFATIFARNLENALKIKFCTTIHPKSKIIRSGEFFVVRKHTTFALMQPMGER